MPELEHAAKRGKILVSPEERLKKKEKRCKKFFLKVAFRTGPASSVLGTEKMGSDVAPRGAQ